MNILIGSCGGLSGIFLSQQLRKKYFVVGIDSSDNAGRFFVHIFIKVP